MWVNISIPCILWVFLFLFSLFCRIGVDGQFIRQSCFNIIDSILQLFWPPSLVQECIGPKKALDPPNKRGWMTLFWNRVLLDLQSPPVTWDRMILRVSTGWSGVVVKWLSAKERWPQWDMQIPPQILPWNFLKRLVLHVVFSAWEIWTWDKTGAPTQVPEASQVYLRLELAIYFRCKKCQFFHPNCFGWWEAPWILGFIWCGSSVCVFSCFGNYAKHRQYDAYLHQKLNGTLPTDP